MKLMFIDDRMEEILQLWKQSQCNIKHQLVPFEVFRSIEQTIQMVERFSPDVLVVGYGLSQLEINGADVIKAVRATGWKGYVIANSGGGEEQFKMAGVVYNATIDRNFLKLKKVLKDIERI